MKKKIIIIGVIVLLVIGACVGSYFLFFNKDKDSKPATDNKDEKITITFDADGGSKVEDMVVKKGSSFQLPETTKKGYTFAGWYNGSKLYTDDDTASIKKDIVLTAKWEEKESEKKFIKITYDSKGGSKVKADEFECVNDSYTIESFPKNPTKDGYTFRAWEDKHGKVILTGAKLTCENITLYAAWDKKEETKPTVTTTKTCTEGELKGDKCVVTKAATFNCPAGSREDGDKCVVLTVSNDGQRTCPSLYIEGHDYPGTKVDAGTTFCRYALVTSYTTKASCEAVSNGLSIDKDGHYDWVGSEENGKCYKASLQNYETTCDSGYKYYSSADIQNKFGGHMNGKCYKVTDKVGSCETGYTLDGKNCTKTTDAK